MKKLLFLSIALIANVAHSASRENLSMQMPKLTQQQVEKLKELRDQMMQINNYEQANNALNKFVTEATSYSVELIQKNTNEDPEVKQLAQEVMNKELELRNKDRFEVIQRIYNKTRDAQNRKEIADAMRAEYYNPEDFFGTFRAYNGENKDRVKQWFEEIRTKYNQSQ